MEELSSFFEREAECFERDDALSLSDIEKLEVDENMPEMKRAEFLLTTGLEKQKSSVLTTLPKILANNNSTENFNIILQCLKSMVQNLDLQIQGNSVMLIEILKAIGQLANATVDGKILPFPTMSLYDVYKEQWNLYLGEKRLTVFLIPDDTIVKIFVPFVLEIVGDIKQKEYAEVAAQAIIYMLPRLSGSNLQKTQIIRMALAKGDVSETPGSRLLCCHILGAITALNLLTAQEIEKYYLIKMLSLCQDTDTDVRKCMCIQLDALARSIGKDKASSDLLPELLELLADEEEIVKERAYRLLLSLLDFFLETELEQLILPELLKFAERPPSYLILTLAETYGTLVTKLSAINHFTNDIKSAFLSGYQMLCEDSHNEVRQYCAYNFPSIVQAFGPSSYEMLLGSILLKFCLDSDENVRYRSASGIHEVARIIGQKAAVTHISDIYSTLLKDQDPTVQGMAIKRVVLLVPLIFQSKECEEHTYMMEQVLKAMGVYQGILPPSRNRDQVEFIETLCKLPALCHPDQMYEVVIPVLFDFLEDGCRPVQLAALDAIVKCIRRMDTSIRRYTLLNKLRTEFGHGRSHWRRILYLDACTFSIAENSRQYCCLNYLDIAIDLLEDPVPNVRWKAITMIPILYRIFIQASNEELQDRLRQFLHSQGAQEPDRDVSMIRCEINQRLERSGSCDMNTRKSEDPEDCRKLLEESQLDFFSDHEDTSPDAKWSNMLEYSLVVGKDGQVVRRARVKTLDVVSKLRTSRKMTPSTTMGNSSVSLVGLPPSVGNLSMGSQNGSNIANLSMNGATPNVNALSLNSLKLDGSNSRSAKPPKTPTKTMVTTPMTTLPNCVTTRPSSTKGHGSKSNANTVGQKSSGNKAVWVGARSATPTSNMTTGVTTKIPIIRPTAPAKRENSPPLVGNVRSLGSTSMNGNLKSTKGMTSKR